MFQGVRMRGSLVEFTCSDDDVFAPVLGGHRARDPFDFIPVFCKDRKHDFCAAILHRQLGRSGLF